MLLILCASCETPDNGTRLQGIEKPAQLDTLDNLLVHTPEEQEFDTVELVRDQVYRSTDDVLFEGYVSHTQVDDQGRVFIKVAKPGAAAIHVFGSDGRHLAKIGRVGKGPGEFLHLGSMDIQGNYLYVYDPRMQRISSFSLSTLSHSGTVNLRRDTSFNASSYSQFFAEGDLYAMKDGCFVMRFGHLSPEDNDEYYLNIDHKGRIHADTLLWLKGPELYDPPTPEPGFFAAYTPVPFSRGPLFTQLDDGTMYTAWSEHFLIKVYDRTGSYQKAIYYPYRKSPLQVDQLDMDNNLQRRLEENEEKIPATWPALLNIITDDQDRLWVATITESDSTFQWWVLNQQGELLGRFQWPGERLEKSVQHAFRITIKDGYWYEREVDYEGVNQIVRYRINFKSRSRSLANN